MAKYEVSDIRNVGLIGHVGTGKTSLADAILFNVGLNTRLGKVDNETSLMDFEPEEVKRKTSISSSFASFEYKTKHFNIVDTPGAAHFIADAKNCIQAVDTCLFVIDAFDGIKVQTLDLIDTANKLNKSTAVFINKIERENSNYKKALETLDDSGLNKPVLVQMPIGQESHFKGVIDLLKMKAYIYQKDESGKFVEEEIPADLLDEAQSIREESIESIIEADDSVLEKYLEGEELTTEEIFSCLKKGVAEGTVTPVLFGAGSKNIGVAQLLELIITSFPSPCEKTGIVATDKTGNEVVRKPSRDEPLSALVCKSIADPYAGQLTIVRLYSGKMESDSSIYNASKETKERYGQILTLQGKKQETLESAGAGDIIALAKLKETKIGDTFADEKAVCFIPMIEQPKPVISFAVKPKSKGDEDKIQTSLRRLMEEDTTLIADRNEQTKEMIISGMGQVHVEVSMEKMKRKFGVEVDLTVPKIAYRETIQGKAEAQGKHKKQSGGRGQYGDCNIEVEPLPRGEGFKFVDNIVGGAIPRNYIPAVEAGIREALTDGLLAGYPIVDMKVRLYDGSYHPVDSSELAFKIAGSLAIKNSVPKASPVLLEPIMNVSIIIPEEYVGDIMGDLNSRRGRMHGVDSQGKAQIVKATIPLAEMLRYSPDLDSMTSGSGTFTMEFSHYEEVPVHLQQKIVDEAKAEKEAARA
ncbi:MAG: elongation factor G [Cyanobacteriota bacterium]